MIKNFTKSKRATLLCSGPMSKNCIDVVIELSKRYDIPQVLIASRRQVDSFELGGGYVENFTTKKFAQYVKNLNANKVFLARDHGGPWQGVYEKENNLDLEESMRYAKKSFEEDVRFGFNFLHIDPSIPVQQEKLTVEKILDRLFELYGYIDEFAKKNDKNIQFELGTEEQNGYGQDLEQFEYFLNKTQKFCEKNKIKKPTFVVAQTGTKVMETQNIGIFANLDKHDFDSLFKHIKKVVAICDKYDVLLKEHNTDYLSNEALLLRPFLGIHASNVAPEFGVAETKALLYLLNIFECKKEVNLFVQIALESKKWTKWMLKNSSASELEKAIICGHYIFADERIGYIKERLAKKMLKQNAILDDYLKRAIRQSITRYLIAFKMIG